MEVVLWIVVCVLGMALLVTLERMLFWRHESRGWEGLTERLLDGRRYGPIARAALRLETALNEFGPDPAAVGGQVQALEDAMAAEIPGVFDEKPAAPDGGEDETDSPNPGRWPL